MKKEFGQLSHWWNGSFEQIKGFFCSRKYNGWSALWDGGITKGMTTDKIPWYKKEKMQVSTGLWSLGRNDNPDVINAPPFWTQYLPKGVPMHGELWYKDRLDVIKRICGTKKMFDPMWLNIQYLAFNIKPYYKWFPVIHLSKDNEPISPIVQAANKTSFFCRRKYSESYDELKIIQEELGNKVFQLVVSPRINTEDDLKTMQETAIKHKWEGLIFANPNGEYECGRSYNSLKWKGVCENDAIILDYDEGKTGKNIGKVGAIKAHLEWDEQVLSLFGGEARMIGEEAIFSIGGLTDQEREWDYCKKHYPIGAKIKFNFFGVSTHGIPQSCNIWRG